MKKYEESSPIKEFYKNKVVFLTGGTGFLGQITIEKLLRCTDIEKLYFLIRPKKNVSWRDRIDQLFSDPLFDTLKKEKPNFKDRVAGVAGDCTLPYLGLTPEDRQFLGQRINIVFHGAASVRFDDKLSKALTINVIGTQNIIAFCKEMTNLEAFVYVSTAFSNCNRIEVNEEIYEPTKDMIKIMNSMGKELLDATQETFIGDFPNSYVFSKHIAESVVKKTASDLPTVVFRPAIVIATYKSPVTGWVNNFYGPIGVTYGVATGALRVFPVPKKTHFQLVPVDLVVNAILSTAWDIAERKKNSSKALAIYNFVPKRCNPIKMRDFIEMQMANTTKIPLSKSFWYCSFEMVESITLAKLLHIIYHVIPAFFVDIVLALMGKRFRLMPIYRKIRHMMDALPFFYYNQWIFHDNNVSDLWRRLDEKDKNWLPFDMGQVEWDKYINNALQGMRYYVAKEDASTISLGIAKQRKFKFMHYSIVYSIRALLMYFLILLVAKFYYKT